MVEHQEDFQDMEVPSTTVEVLPALLWSSVSVLRPWETRIAEACSGNTIKTICTCLKQIE